MILPISDGCTWVPPMSIQRLEPYICDADGQDEEQRGDQPDVHADRRPGPGSDSPMRETDEEGDDADAGEDELPADRPAE